MYYPVKTVVELKMGNSFKVSDISGRYLTYSFDKKSISFSRHARMVVQKSNIGHLTKILDIICQRKILDIIFQRYSGHIWQLKDKKCFFG